MPKPAVEDEVGELALTLEEMLRSLDAARTEREGAMQKQREFVADASHELRTPLTSVLANLELLQASLRGTDQAEDREVVDSALRSSSRMSRLVGDLLLLARADAGRLDKHRRCDLAEVAGDAAAEAAPLMGERTLRARQRPPAAGGGQPRRAAPDGPQPARQRRPSHARPAPGSSSACGPKTATRWSKWRTTGRVFRRRCGSRSSTASSAAKAPPIPPRGTGTGLGLAIVSAVTDSHGGSVEAAESNPAAPSSAPASRWPTLRQLVTGPLKAL